jgi:FlgD Ig-like domain
MRNTVILLICIVFISVIQAEINDLHLVVNAGEDETLLYDHDAGICQSGDNIYLVYYLTYFANDNHYFNLKFSLSTDGGIEFVEQGLYLTTLDSCNIEYEMIDAYLPSIQVDDAGIVYIFYFDLHSARAMVAVSSDQGNTFAHQHLTGMLTKSQFKVLNTDNGLLIAAMEEDKIPMSRFQYVTQYEESENSESYDPENYCGDVVFFGIEVMDGITISDDDIWIRQIGGGNNNGWPTFEQLVITSERIMDYTTGSPAVNSAPMDDIFLGGYIEQAAHFLYPSEAETIRANGIILEESSEYDVLLAQIEGNIAHLRYANYVTQIDTFTVYNSFPDPAHPDLAIGDSIWVNEITTRELVWEEETTDLEITDTSVFVNCQLWIEGSIGSNMTWGCADTVYITSDICYADIEMGDPAEDSQYMFGLVSEERMLIKYKYRDINGIIHDDNCSSVYLYGSYAALGDGDIELYGDMNTHYEGIFSFEYQHPHGSTPGFSFELPSGETWDVPYPDFHKFIFPPDPLWTGDPGFQFHGNDPAPGSAFYSCGYPYENPGYGDSVTPPYGADYPWYNPVYPEEACSEMGERGFIHHYGGIQQRRFGYVHRSGADPDNHSDDDWDIDHWQYSGTHGMLGYDQQFHWDTRMDSIAPPDYPELEFLLGPSPYNDNNIFSLYSFDPQTLSAEVIDRFQIDQQPNLKLIDFCQTEDKIAFLIEKYGYINEYQIISRIGNEWSVIDLADINPGNSLEFWQDYYIIKGDDQIYVLDFQGNHMPLPDLNQFSNVADYQPAFDGILFSITGETPLWHFDLRQVGIIPLFGSYDFSFSEQAINSNTSLEIVMPQADQLLMQILKNSHNEFRYCTDYIYLATGDVSDLLTGTISDEIVLSTQFKCYPNPFTQSTTLKYDLPRNIEDAEIVIYNIKGQKVRTLPATSNEVKWDCRNQDGNLASSGIYFYKLQGRGFTSTTGKMILLR